MYFLPNYYTPPYSFCSKITLGETHIYSSPSVFELNKSTEDIITSR